ncbi:MAG: carbon storage regulator [Clostridia bacterium]|nr:carbon storage regulator [Clostridia bacterium]
MLSLQLKSGEYLTIGEEIAVQVFKQSGNSFRVAVKAPREMAILRGEVLERSDARPEGLHDKRPKSPSEKARDAQKLQRLREKQRRHEAERQRIADEQRAVTEELRSLLDQAGALQAAHGTIPPEAIARLRRRLDTLSPAPAGSAQEEQSGEQGL